MMHSNYFVETEACMEVWNMKNSSNILFILNTNL